MTEAAATPPRASWARRVARTVKGFVLWEYERGSWQYDVMVALIVVFVLFTPTRYFHDQPAEQDSSGGAIVRLDARGDTIRYRLSADLLAGFDAEPRQAAEQALAADLGYRVTVTRIQEIEGPDGNPAWYDVWVRR